jgi:UDP-2-acetamido-2,6-beta-L-arabino-hexul-4-ose reductase
VSNRLAWCYHHSRFGYIQITIELVRVASERYSSRSKAFLECTRPLRSGFRRETRMSESTSPLTVGITGPRGFIAGHLARYLSVGAARSEGTSAASTKLGDRNINISSCSRETFSDMAALFEFVETSDTIVHLAGSSRGSEREIYENNTSLIDKLVAALEATNCRPHVVFPSSPQRDRTNAYGRSKKYAEGKLREWASRTSSPLTILVCPSVYGPGCRPYRNSVVATFCHQLAHDQEPVVIGDEALDLVWINDLIDAIGQLISARRFGIHEARVAVSAGLSTSRLLEKLQAIRDSYFAENVVPNLSDPFDASLYTTFFSSIDLDDHCRRPRLQNDARGQLFEVLRLAGGGQLFFSTIKPGVIRGNHFHSRKVERFCVVRGEAIIRIRQVGEERVREFHVSGTSPEFISVPALCTHQIENVGNEDLLTMFWCNEIFEPGDPDTFFEKVA